MLHSKLVRTPISIPALVAVVFTTAVILSLLPVHFASAAPIGTPVPSAGTGGTASPSSNGNAGVSSSNGGGGSQTIANPLKFNSLDELLNAILKAAIQLGTIILTLALMWTGFKFVEARGNEEKIRSARSALMWTVVGGLILLGATAIKEVISSTITSITP